MTDRVPEEFFHQYLTRSEVFFRFYWATYAAKVWFTGSGFVSVLRWWHPITLLVLVIMTVLAIPVCLLTTETIGGYFSSIMIRLRLSPYHRARVHMYPRITHASYESFKNGRQRT